MTLLTAYPVEERLPLPRLAALGLTLYSSGGQPGITEDAVAAARMAEAR